ncbi:MAG: hypothetical protein AAFU49_23535, partial [Pseudomonadota bacterium]
MTRQQDIDIVEHLLYTVADFDQGATQPIPLVMDDLGITNFSTFVSFIEADFEGLQFNDAGTLRNLNRGLTKRIQYLLRFTHRMTLENNNIVPPAVDWMNVTRNQFLNYCASCPPVNPNMIPRQSVGTNQDQANLATYRKGVKRDPSLFPVLKDLRQFDNWNRAVLAQAKAQDVSEVFDRHYVPANADQVELFRMKQNFVFAVFVAKLLADESKALVRQYETDSDAQSIYRDLLEIATSSVGANIEADDLLEFLSCKKLDHTWKGSTIGFILHWNEQLRKYENLIPIAARPPEASKKRMLENAVSGIEDLQHVKTTEEANVTLGHAPTTFIQYLKLLKAAAIRRDRTLHKMKNRGRLSANSHYLSYEHELQDESPTLGYLDDGEAFFDPSVHMDHSIVDVYRSDRQTSSESVPRIPADVWKELPLEAQLILKRVPKPQRDKVLAERKQRPPQRSQVHFHDTAASMEQQSNDDELRNAVLYLLQQHQQQQQLDRKPPPQPPTYSANATETVADTPHPPETSSTPDASDPSVYERLFNSSERSPYDFRTLLATTSRNQRQINLSYRITSGTTDHRLSLVDRGANGGLGGADVCLLETTNRSVDIVGIGDHTIDNCPVGTVAGVAHSQHGPVCLIMHQYAWHGKGKSIHSCVQLEAFGTKVDDRSMALGGKLAITTLDGYVLPLSFQNGLAYLPLRPPSDDELLDLHHVVLCSDEPWDPAAFDQDNSDVDAYMNRDDVTVPDDNIYGDLRFDRYGNYRGQYNHETVAINNEVFFDTLDINHAFVHVQLDHVDDFFDPAEPDADADPPVVPDPPKYFYWDPLDLNDYVDECIRTVRIFHRTQWRYKPPDLEILRPYLNFAPADIVAKTLEVTTQWGRHVAQDTYRRV